MNLHQWAARWGVPFEAVAELQDIFGMNGTATTNPPKSNCDGEDAALQAVRLEAPRKGVMLWRNNTGAMQDATGRVVRYGLCNDSKALNEKIKSGDLVGIRPIMISPDMIGYTFGQFVSREVKAPGWHFTGTDRETAQLKWIQLIASRGGDAAFCTGEGSL